MNRGEALEIINGIERHLANQGMTDEEYRLDEALVTLGVYKHPDPITGLVPCGCGGKPVFIEFFDGFFDHERITCSECQIEFTTTSVGCGALLWNKAMGWRGDNES